MKSEGGRGAGTTLQGSVNRFKEFGFFPECNGKSMEGFTPWDSVILPMWHKAHVSGCMKNGLQNGSQESSHNDYSSAGVE